MKLSKSQIDIISKFLLKEMKECDDTTLNVDDSKVLQKTVEVILKNIAEENVLDAEVNTMMDDLEKQNPEGFQRYKMFPMLKKKLADQKGFVL